MNRLIALHRPSSTMEEHVSLALNAVLDRTIPSWCRVCAPFGDAINVHTCICQ